MPERVVGQEPADQRLALAEEQLHGLGRLHHPDESREHAQDASFVSGRDEAGGGGMG